MPGQVKKGSVKREWYISLLLMAFILLFLNKQLHTFIFDLYPQIMLSALPSSYYAKHIVGTQYISSMGDSVIFIKETTIVNLENFTYQVVRNNIFLPRRMYLVMYIEGRVIVASIMFLAD